MQPMQTPRRLSPLLAVLATLATAAALVSGCSSSSKQSGAALPDAATLIKESSQVTKTVKSVHLVLSVNGKIKHLPIKTLTGDLTTTPATAAQGNANITFGGSDIDAQFVVDGGTLYATAQSGSVGELRSGRGDLRPVVDPQAGHRPG